MCPYLEINREKGSSSDSTSKVPQTSVWGTSMWNPATTYSPGRFTSLLPPLAALGYALSKYNVPLLEIQPRQRLSGPNQTTPTFVGAVFFGIRQRPTLPARLQASTIGAERLNFCVRYGNRWIPFAMVTGILSRVCAVPGSLGLRSVHFLT